jgi:hypothetical protein
MGVGAVFISTLALKRLPTPHDPPQNQQELLATVLQPITAFVVLGSILVRKSIRSIFHPPRSDLQLYPDGLSIPFFSFGRQVHSRTVSLSATLTTRSRGEPPDWLLWARRSATIPKEPEASTVVSDVDVERLAAETAKNGEANATAGAVLSPRNDIIEEVEVASPTSGKSSESTILSDTPEAAVSILTNKVSCGFDSSCPFLFKCTQDQVEFNSRGITARVEDTENEQLPGKSKTVRFPASE